jgi:hypothetical protein
MLHMEKRFDVDENQRNKTCTSTIVLAARDEVSV